MSGEPQLRAKVRLTREAHGAATARYGRIDGHPIPGARTGLDRTDEFVAQDERLRQNSVADPTLAEPVPIGAAEADGGHAQEELSVAWYRRRLLVQTKVSRAVKT
ncbi:MAG TPA: hypothetical protein VF327_07060 [Gaiellaceae bacterium]